MDLERVVIGLDSSAAAAAAARDSGGEVLAVHGIGTSPELLGEAVADASRGLGFVPSEVEDVAPSDVDTTEAVRLVLEERWCRPLREAGVAYRTVVSESDPVEALLLPGVCPGVAMTWRPKTFPQQAVGLDDRFVKLFLVYRILIKCDQFVKEIRSGPRAQPVYAERRCSAAVAGRP